jgi:hypothetical protein
MQSRLSTQELLSFLFDHSSHPLRAQVDMWLSSSKRFRLFVETNDKKIRKKLLTAQEDEAAQDLGRELETAYLLLQEARFALDYEKRLAGKTQTPDFLLTFKTHIPLGVEVTRLRGGELPGEESSGEEDFGSHARLERRLGGVICRKLGQMTPGMANLLIVAADSSSVCQVELEQVMAELKRRAEQREPALFSQNHFRTPADFFRDFLRLSTLLVRHTPLPACMDAVSPCARLWLNPEAKVPLPVGMAAALLRVAGAASSDWSG